MCRVKYDAVRQRGERLVGAQPPQNGARDPLRSAALPPAPAPPAAAVIRQVKLHYMQNEGAKPRGGRGRVGKKRSAVGALVGSAVGRQGTLVGQRYTALI